MYSFCKQEFRFICMHYMRWFYGLWRISPQFYLLHQPASGDGLLACPSHWRQLPALPCWGSGQGHGCPPQGLSAGRSSASCAWRSEPWDAAHTRDWAPETTQTWKNWFPIRSYLMWNSIQQHKVHLECKCSWMSRSAVITVLDHFELKHWDGKWTREQDTLHSDVCQEDYRSSLCLIRLSSL